MNPSPKIEITRQRLALQLIGARVDPDSASRAAALLEARLGLPNLLDEVTPAASEPRSGLLCPPDSPSICERPVALFEQLPRLTPFNVPIEWMMPFILWGTRRGRWKQFKECQKILEAAGELIPKISVPEIYDLPSRDSIVAGLVLFYCGPKPGFPLRRQLLELALAHPLGAYLAAESLHIPDEVPAIANALRDHSRLLHQVSQLPDFKPLCVRKAQTDHSLWAGLTLAHDPQNQEALNLWLQRAASAAGFTPVAAVAILVLQPDAPENLRELWLTTLKHPAAAHWAFQTVWWSRLTWPPAAWEKLKADLRPYATADRGAGWFNWSLLEPEWSYADYELNPVDPLWSVEYLQQRQAARLTVNDRPLRTQMVERLIQNHGDRMAKVVLKYLDQLNNEGSAR
jgi:hypothetical protein